MKQLNIKSNIDLYLINRTDRPERRKHAIDQFRAQGVNAHVIPAVIDAVGWRGCRDSHLLCLNKGLQAGEPFLVFEDDVLFLTDIDEAFIAATELPGDWDALFLGASPQEPQDRYSDRLYRLSKAWCTHAIMWNPRPSGAVEYIVGAGEQGNIKKIDVFLSNEVFPYFNCFLTWPMICTQAEFKSDVALRSNVSTIERNYRRFCL